jgi:hypothetical protein
MTIIAPSSHTVAIDWRLDWQSYETATQPPVPVKTTSFFSSYGDKWPQIKPLEGIAKSETPHMRGRRFECARNSARYQLAF